MKHSYAKQAFERFWTKCSHSKDSTFLLIACVNLNETILTCESQAEDIGTLSRSSPAQ